MRRKMENMLQIKVQLLQRDTVDHPETEKKNQNGKEKHEGKGTRYRTYSI